MMNVASLFSGIGGFEVGLAQAGHQTILMCENDVNASAVLTVRFPDVPLHDDVKTLPSLPSCDILVAGWPCQDLSQAGLTAGMGGTRSSLVGEIFRLLDASEKMPPLIILENVAFSLSLRNGEAVTSVVQALEDRGYRWAYRILDSIHFGLPQRRRRVFICASLDRDPAAILFETSQEEQAPFSGPETHVGFYWTEGNRGVGWTPNAVPPLKGGSSFAIPSPPAIWDKSSGSFFTPSIRDAERLQGFEPDWTAVRESDAVSNRKRWRLVGNAVSVPVAAWIARRLAIADADARLDESGLGGTPNAAFGGPSQTAKRLRLPEAPQSSGKTTLAQFGLSEERPLSQRAARGFAERYARSKLRINPAFLEQLRAYCSLTTKDNSDVLDSDRACGLATP